MQYITILNYEIGTIAKFVNAFGTDKFELEHDNFKGNVNKQIC